MAPEAPVPVRALDEILTDVLTAATPIERLLAHAEGVRGGYSGTRIADFCEHCAGPDGPWVVLFSGLLKHLIETDAITLTRLRGHWHTPANVTVWDEDEGGHGRALGRGPAV
jgi:hypothetical protein